MNKAVTFASSQVCAADLLDGVRTIRFENVYTCDWLPKWLPETTFLDWAKRGLSEDDGYGLSNAINYAKKAVGCRIDGLLRSYHMVPLFRANYPDKIAALEEIGLSIPSVVYELVIDPRNELEHGYGVPDPKESRHAVEIAELFISATNDESSRKPIVAVNWNVLAAHFWGNELHRIEFHGFSNHPMLFIDVFDGPYVAKIVDPQGEEIRWTELSAFSRTEAIQLAKFLRSRNAGSLSHTARIFFTEVKRQGGF